MANRIPNPYDFLPSVSSFELTSDDIADGQTLADTHVYAAGNTSPQLRWSGAPAGTRSFVVTAYDPDAPTGGGFWHWVAVNLPADTTELPRGAGAGDGSLPGPDSFHARNDFSEYAYGGSAPPPGHGPHRYIFVVHAVDVDKLDVDRDTPPNRIGFNLFMHTLGRAQLVPEYAQD